MTGLDEYGPETVEPPKPGRPSDYSAELAAVICERLVDGESLRSICSGQDMPDKSTVFRWLARHELFRDQYARAREAQADSFAEDILDIADDTSGDKKIVGDETPIEVVDHEHIARSRLRVDTRKWLMSRTAPKKYGDRVTQEVSGPNGGPIPIERIERVIVDPAAPDGTGVRPATEPGPV